MPGYRVDRLVEAVHRFRNAWSRHHRPDDVNHLLRLFRHVELQRGYALDYRHLRAGEDSWIWPFAHSTRPGQSGAEPVELARVPPDQLQSAARGKTLRALEAATLYRFLDYKRTAVGLVEYGFFINELWALKSERREREWLSLEPLLVRHKFDAIVRRHHKQLVRLSRPADFDLRASLETDSGSFTFLAFQSGPWRRIARIEVEVAGDGAVAWAPSKVLATLSN